MTFRERFNKGNSQFHARNSFHALTTTVCTETDALRKSYSSKHVFISGSEYTWNCCHHKSEGAIAQSGKFEIFQLSELINVRNFPLNPTETPAARAGLARFRPLAASDAQPGPLQTNMPDGWFYNETKESDFWDDIEKYVVGTKQQEDYEKEDKRKDYFAQVNDSSTRIKSILGHFDDIDEETLIEMTQLADDPDELGEDSAESILNNAKNQVLEFISEMQELADSEMGIFDGLKMWFRGLKVNGEFLKDEAAKNSVVVDKTKVLEEFERLSDVIQERSERVESLHRDVSTFWSQQMFKVKRELMMSHEETKQLKEKLAVAQKATTKEVTEWEKQREEMARKKEQEEYQKEVQKYLLIIKDQKRNIDKLKEKIKDMEGENAMLLAERRTPSMENMTNTLKEKVGAMTQSKFEDEMRIAMLNQRIAQLESDGEKTREMVKDEQKKEEALIKKVGEREKRIEELEQSVKKYIQLLELEKSRPRDMAALETQKQALEKAKLADEERLIQIAALKEQIEESDDRLKQELMKQSEMLSQKFAIEKKKLIVSLTSDGEQADAMTMMITEYEEKLAEARKEYDASNENLLRRMGAKISILTRQYENRLKQLTIANESLILQKNEEVKYEAQKARIEIEDEFNCKVIEISSKANATVMEARRQAESLKAENERLEAEVSNYKAILSKQNIEPPKRSPDEAQEIQSLSETYLELSERFGHRMNQMKRDIFEEKDWELSQQKQFYENQMQKQLEEHQKEERMILLKVQDAISKFQTEGETVITISDALSAVSDAYEQLNQALETASERKEKTQVPLDQAKERLHKLTDIILELQAANEELKNSSKNVELFQSFKAENAVLTKRIEILEAAQTGDSVAVQKMVNQLIEEHKAELDVKDVLIEQLKMKKIDDFVGQFEHFEVFEAESKAPPSVTANMSIGSLVELPLESVEYDTEYEDDDNEEAEPNKRQKIKVKTITKVRVKEVPKFMYVECPSAMAIPEFAIGGRLVIEKKFTCKYHLQHCTSITLETTQQDDGGTNNTHVVHEQSPTDAMEKTEECVSLDITEEPPTKRAETITKNHSLTGISYRKAFKNLGVVDVEPVSSTVGMKYLSVPVSVHIPVQFVEPEERPQELTAVSTDSTRTIQLQNIFSCEPIPPKTLIIYADEDTKERISELTKRLTASDAGDSHNKMLKQLPQKALEFMERRLKYRDVRIQILRDDLEEAERQQRILRQRKTNQSIDWKSIPHKIPQKQETPEPPLREEETETEEVRPILVQSTEQEETAVEVEVPHMQIDLFEDDEPVDSVDPYTDAVQMMSSNVRFIATFLENEERLSSTITSDINAYESFLRASDLYEESHKSIVEDMRENLKGFVTNIDQMNSFQLRQHKLLKICRMLKRDHLQDEELASQAARQNAVEQLQLQSNMLANINENTTNEADQLMLVQKLENSLQVVASMNFMNDKETAQHKRLLASVHNYMNELKQGNKIDQSELDKSIISVQDFIVSLKPSFDQKVNESIMKQTASQVRAAKRQAKHIANEKASVEKELGREKLRSEQLIQKIRSLQERLDNQEEMNENTANLYNAQILNMKSLLEQMSKLPNGTEGDNDVVSQIRAHVISMQTLSDTALRERDVYKSKCFDAEDRVATLEEEKQSLESELYDVKAALDKLELQTRKNAEKWLFHEGDMEKLKQENEITEEAKEKQIEQIEELTQENSRLSKAMDEKDSKIRKLKNKLIGAQAEIDDLSVKLNIGIRTKKIIAKPSIGTQTGIDVRQAATKHKEVRQEAVHKQQQNVPSTKPEAVLATVETSDSDEPQAETVTEAPVHPEEVAPKQVEKSEDVDTEPVSEFQPVPMPDVAAPEQRDEPATPVQSHFADEEDSDVFDETFLETSRHEGQIDLINDRVITVHQPLNWNAKKFKKITTAFVTPKKAFRPKTAQRPKVSRITHQPDTSDLSIGDVTPGRRQLTGTHQKIKPMQTTRVTRKPDVDPGFEPIEAAVQFKPLPATQPPTPSRMTPQPRTFSTELPPPSPYEYESLRITRYEYEDEEQPQKVPSLIVQPIQVTPPVSRPQSRPSPEGSSKFEEIHRIVARLRDKIEKLRNQNDSKDKTIDELKRKLTDLIKRNQQLKTTGIRLEEDAKIARLRYDNLQLRFEVMFKELALKEDELSRAHKELTHLRNISVPALSRYNKLQNARGEQLRLLKEKQKQREVLDVAKTALSNAPNEATEKHIRSILENTQRTMIKLEAKREMAKEMEKKHMMAVLGALSLIDEKPVFNFEKRVSPFRQNRLQIVGPVTRVPEVEELIPVIERKAERKRPTIPSFSKSIEIMDRVQPPLNEDEKRQLLRGLPSPEVAAKLRKVEEEMKQSEAFGDERITGH